MCYKRHPKYHRVKSHWIPMFGWEVSMDYSIVRDRTRIISVKSIPLDVPR